MKGIPMNQNDLRNLCNTSCKEVISDTVLLYQRNLISEATNWLRKVDTRAKQLRTGKIILVAVLKDD